MEGAHGPDGGIPPALPCKVFRQLLYFGPVFTQRLDDGRHHQPFDIDARGEMRAQPAALFRRQCALQQRSEDSGFDVLPVLPGRQPEFANIVGFELERRACLEQRTVELFKHSAEFARIFTFVHRAPKVFERDGKYLGMIDHPLEHRLERTDTDALFLVGFLDQPHVLGEHGEEAAHEEFGDILRVVSALEALGNLGEAFGNVLGNFSADTGRIEAVRIGPDRAQALLHILFEQILHREAVALPVREMGVVAALPAEIGIDFDDIADIGDENKGRVGVIVWQRTGVIFRLLLGGDHHPVPTFGATLGMTQLLGRLDAHQFQLLGRAHLLALGGLLRFPDEAIALVAIYPARRRSAVRMPKGDITLKDMVVMSRVFTRW